MILFVAQVAAANLPPARPTILEPALDEQALNGADVHMVTSPFVDEDDGDGAVCSDWEIRNDADEIVWSAGCAAGPNMIHIHLGDGVFSGTHNGMSELRAGSSFLLRVRHRDDSGDAQTEWSEWASRPFRTVLPTPVVPLRLIGVLGDPPPRWTSGGEDVAVPSGARLDLEAVDAESFLRIDADGTAVGESERSKVVVRLRIVNGDGDWTLPESELSFEDIHGRAHTLFLPTVAMAPSAEVSYWISANGSTHEASSDDRAPDFGRVARGALVPWEVERGFRADLFASGFELPVSVAAVPQPGLSADSPYLYVAELYGSIKVVTRGGEVREFAKGLLNFDPRAPIPGSGERGLGGITVDPANGDVIVSAIYQPSPDSPLISPRVLRLQSDDGGYTAARILPVIEFPNVPAFPSHQISNVTFGPDDKLYVHVGNSLAPLSQDLNTIDGKILRMNADGTAPADNPFYDSTDGLTATDILFAIGFRNPFGGAWRFGDRSYYAVDNGPSVDRLAQIVAGRNYLWDGSDASMRTFALYNWETSVAPVQIAFVERERFGGSGFPSRKQGSAFVTESGPTWSTGPQTLGKRISEFEIGPDGSLLGGPKPFAVYNGSGKATAVGLTVNEDGLFFTDLYRDYGQSSPFDAGANLFRIHWTGFADFTARFLSPSMLAFFDHSDVPDFQSISWDFGDGTTSDERNPVHRYERSGTYLVRQAVATSRGTLHHAERIFVGEAAPVVVAAYYESDESTMPTVIQVEPSMTFDWSDGAPAPSIPDRGFAAWFATEITPRFSEVYTFNVFSDDPVRLMMDGNVLIDAWDNEGQNVYTAAIELTAGHRYAFAVQYANESETVPSLSVTWESASQPAHVVPLSTGDTRRRSVRSK